jgi:hypothetical protein
MDKSFRKMFNFVTYANNVLLLILTLTVFFAKPTWCSVLEQAGLPDGTTTVPKPVLNQCTFLKKTVKQVTTNNTFHRSNVPLYGKEVIFIGWVGLA